jgi:DNA-binding NarL/FixJ family response regulator
MTNTTTKILLVDDHKIVREGLKALLERETHFEVVAEATNGEEAIKLAEQYQPDIIIMDISMPNLNGIEATRQIASAAPEIKIIVLSIYFDKHLVAKMLRAGAMGYLRKDCASEELVRAITIVRSNKFYISPSLGVTAGRDIMNGSDIPHFIAFEVLTTKEREVLQLVAEGKPTKEIARRLHVSVKTIDNHRQKIMTKLDIHSIAELTKFAIREGITSIES